MPSTVTHAFFALDVFEKLNKEIQSKIDIEYLKTFSEGPDPLYFYYLYIPFYKDIIRKTYPRKIHDTKTKEFFITFIKEIKDKNFENNKTIVSFIYGFICHYALDSIIHPFIIYKTGEYRKNDVKTYKYRSLHLDMELYLDSYMIFQRKKIPSKDFKMYNFCFNIKKFDKQLINILDEVFKKVYNLDNFANIYYKSILQMKKIYRIFRYDKTGIKLRLYKCLDIVLPKKQLKKEQLSYHINYKKKLHYLNNDKIEWNHPFDQYETYNYSFIELYHIALNKACQIIEQVNKVLFENEDIKSLNRVFNNTSYKSGKDCDDSRTFQYFEY